MAEAIEHVVRGIEEVRDELQEAFLARDSGRTGALGGPAFKVNKIVQKKCSKPWADDGLVGQLSTIQSTTALPLPRVTDKLGQMNKKVHRVFFVSKGPRCRVV